MLYHFLSKTQEYFIANDSRFLERKLRDSHILKETETYLEGKHHVIKLSWASLLKLALLVVSDKETPLPTHPDISGIVDLVKQYEETNE